MVNVECLRFNRRQRHGGGKAMVNVECLMEGKKEVTSDEQ